MNHSPTKAIFEYYTFQLTPTKTTQLDLFEIGITNVKELRERKNAILLQILESKDFNFTYKSHKLNHKVLWIKDDIILLRIANVKSLKAEKSFRPVYYKNEPSIIVAINNHPKSQTLAVEKDVTVFTNSEAVARFIQESLMEKLHYYSLELDINNRFSAEDFWGLVEKHQNQMS